MNISDRCSIKLSCVNVTNNEGYIQSSNFPDSYEDSSDCITIITVPEGARMDIEFVHFMVEQDYDILKVTINFTLRILYISYKLLFIKIPSV